MTKKLVEDNPEIESVIFVLAESRGFRRVKEGRHVDSIRTSCGHHVRDHDVFEANFLTDIVILDIVSYDLFSTAVGAVHVR